ncbi:IclR family transcriptional regulator C-terminal domain-containing protein [Streptomyces lincolnensis]|uniref:IclR family transcriptional regulator domain-containing protein n=1 Tax=Streptomyces lincolnensis TaxID=1915 RepID=UPI0021503C43|nr:IclR family transcriptional regulator C-terminal domain-containing protein [Streptomyces lincolnensis]
MAALPADELEKVLAEPSRSGLTPCWHPDPGEHDAVLREVRARGWALTDEQLAPGIRSVAAPLRDGSDQVIAALNVNCHAAGTSVEPVRGAACASRLVDGIQIEGCGPEVLESVRIGA